MLTDADRNWQLVLGSINTFHKLCAFPHDFHIVSYFVGKPSKSSLSTMVRYIYIYIRRCVEWLDGRWVVARFLFPNWQDIPQDVLHVTIKKNEHMCYGMQLSWLWHVTQCIIYIHTCIKMFFYMFHSGLLSRWDESKHVFCHHHSHKSVMKGLSAPTSSPDALFEVSRHFLAQICWLLAQSAKTCQILPKSVTVTLVLKLLLFFLRTTACKQISRKGWF